MVAIQDIQPGEELFENYQEFDLEFDDYKDELF
jgi:hypothetical protein